MFVRLDLKNFPFKITLAFLRTFENYGPKKFYNVGPRLKRLTMDKRTSLFAVGVTDEEIIFYNFDTRWRRVATASPRRKSGKRRPPSGENLIKLFWAVIKNLAR